MVYINTLKFKRTLSCLFSGPRKVQVTKFAFEDFIFVVGSAANSVGTTLEFAAFGSDSDAKYSRASAFWFLSVHNHGCCGGPNTFSQEKHQHVHVDWHLVMKKEMGNNVDFFR